MKLTFSITFHPQTNGQLERSIHVLEDMLRACVIAFGRHWDKFLPLCESLIIIVINQELIWHL